MPVLIGEMGDYDRWKSDPDFGRREEKCERCSGVKGECDPMHCARCGLQACTGALFCEGCDDWECPSCNRREDGRHAS